MARGEHRTFVDDVGAVADAEGFPNVMIRYEYADAALLEEPNDALDVEHRDRVDAGERLVEQDERRLGAERARDLEAPALAARERDGGVLAQVGDVQVFQELGEARLDLLAREALQLEDRLHVLLHRQAAEHRVLLRQVGDAQARAPVDRQVRELGLVEVDVAGVDRNQPDDHVEAGGLAGAVRPEQADGFAAVDLERDVLHHGARLVTLAQALRAQAAGAVRLWRRRHFSGGLGCSVARTRPSPPLPGVTVKKSLLWSTRMYAPATSSPPRLTRADSNSSILPLFSSSSMRFASPSIHTPSFSGGLGSWRWRKRTGLPVAVAYWLPSESWRTTMRSARMLSVPRVTTTLPSNTFMRRASSALMRFASICVGLVESACSAAAGAAASTAMRVNARR